MNLKEFKTELRYADYTSDKWAQAMSAFFQIAEHLYLRDIDIPTEWQFKQPRYGIVKLDPEDSFYTAFTVSSDTSLLAIGQFLYRLINILEKAGLSY